MEIKKKLKIFLKAHGIVLKWAILSMLVFASLLKFSPKSQAYMSDEYLYYVNQTLAENASSSQAQQINGYLLNDRDGRTSILNILNNQFDIWNIPNIDDSNILVFSNTASAGTMLKIIVCNNSVPAEYTDLDFFKIGSNRIYKYTNDNSPIYQANITLQADIYQKVTVSNQVFYKWDLSDNSASFQFGNTNFSGDSVLRIQNLACCGIPQGFCYKPLNSSTIVPIILEDYNGNYHPVTPDPEPTPSGDTPTVPSGTITNNSGEKTGQIDLSGIEQGIGNIQNQISGDSQKIIDNQNENTQTIVNTISGEVGKITNVLTDDANDTIENTVITSGDIESSLGFEIAEDPYSNFWTTLTDNLKNALLGSKRSINISFQGRTWTISLDEYMVLPFWLTIILIPFSTSFFTWFLVRQWKLIFDKLASGNIDSILKENSEEGISNLF